MLVEEWVWVEALILVEEWVRVLSVRVEDGCMNLMIHACASLRIFCGVYSAVHPPTKRNTAVVSQPAAVTQLAAVTQPAAVTQLAAVTTPAVWRCVCDHCPSRWQYRALGGAR
jgi:hypothetical protein